MTRICYTKNTVIEVLQVNATHYLDFHAKYSLTQYHWIVKNSNSND